MGSQWKREFVQDHKFDFINVDDFIDNSCWRQFRYMLMFAAIIRGILVYCSDIFTAANLLANSNENSFVPKSGVELEVFGKNKLPFEVYKWLFSGCILLGFLLLGLEIRRARAIILSRDISYAFTSLIASRFYSVRSYPHYCLFASIHNSKKMVDEVAFFCFFTFRNWKRLMLADAPRQVINATILYQTFRGHAISFGPKGIFDWDDVVGPDMILKKITLGGMIFTVFMFAFSLIMLLAAVVLYIPLVSHIRGNLKEYCCHKIDKRIDELIRKKSRTRAADEAKETGVANLQQPTLPQVDVLDPPVSNNPRTPRTPYAKPSAPYPPPHPPPQTPKTPYTAYSYGQPTPRLSQQKQQQQQQQQQQYQQHQQGYDYFPPKPKPPGSVIAGSVIGTPKPKESVLDPYAESAFVSDDIYDHYTSDQDQQQFQQSYPNQNNTHQRQDPKGYGYNGGAAYPHVNAPGNGGLGGTRTPPRIATRYDGYRVPPSPTSPIHSQHGSDLGSYHSGSHHGSHHSSQQTGYGQGHNYGAGAGAGAGAGYDNGNGNGNGRYGRGGNTGYGNEYQTPRRRDQSPGQHGGYRGGGGY
ncbi:MAG: hypothetical protein J3Q66DRAFT_27115 [Benniella sp.]|nr:MAG: hypothetical protein J3Q66DRAFT_27115 [Benniella sp.]